MKINHIFFTPNLKIIFKTIKISLIVFSFNPLLNSFRTYCCTNFSVISYTSQNAGIKWFSHNKQYAEYVDSLIYIFFSFFQASETSLNFIFFINLTYKIAQIHCNN